jgi:hypothetical protein
LTYRTTNAAPHAEQDARQNQKLVPKEGEQYISKRETSRRRLIALGIGLDSRIHISDRPQATLFISIVTQRKIAERERVRPDKENLPPQ